MKRGNFFKFVTYLLAHEYNKAREFQLLIDRGGSSAPNKKRHNRVRNRIVFVLCILVFSNVIFCCSFYSNVPKKYRKLVYYWKEEYYLPSCS